MEPTVAILFIVLFLTSAFLTVRGLLKGNIKYGYKYYGKGVTANKKDDASSFWFGIVLYSLIAFASLIAIILYAGGK